MRFGIELPPQQRVYGGFFIYSRLYATIGSIATTNQEAQQLVFPAMMPIIIGFFMSMVAVENPD